MTRRLKNEPFTSVCPVCNTTFETTISTKIYDKWECAKRAENQRRYDRQKQAKADAKQAAE